MVQTLSTMLALGTPALDFALPDPNGRVISLRDFGDAPVLVVIFMCNHCPFVKHVKPQLSGFAREYQAHGVAVVGVNSNDASEFPDDSPAKMLDDIAAFGYAFPYLVDARQSVARAYRAACTPDFFVFNQDRRLAYRGQFDASRPKNDVPVTGADLRAAVDALLDGRPVDQNQIPSIGCNIKWIAGNAPDYVG